MNKLEKKIKRLDNKIANTNLLRHTYILLPVVGAMLTGIATLISIPFSILALQIFGVATLTLVGSTFCLNALSDYIDIKFATKLQKMDKKYKQLQDELNKQNKAIVVEQNIDNANNNQTAYSMGNHDVRNNAETKTQKPYSIEMDTKINIDDNSKSL